MRSNDRMLAAQLAEDLYVGRTFQFEADLERKIQELTPDAVNAGLRKYVDRKKMAVITAGDFKK